MGKRLTVEMVIARAKTSDLSKIKRLNCWGSELVEVRLLHQMPAVEVLSLSINKIDSLEDFQFCRNLEELYMRQNNIRDLNQVYYLQNLPNLKNLWLGENPCANEEGYRLTVLRILPQLQKLDNIPVTLEELREAQRKGKVLYHPEDPDRNDPETSTYEDSTYYDDRNCNFENSPQKEEDSSYSNINEEVNHSDSCRDLRLVTSQSTNSIKEYVNSENYSQPNSRQCEISEAVTCEADFEPQKQERRPCTASHKPPFNRRPAARNSNILSAVLCLVKELDYPSLEVVEMAVRCRMAELDE